jgi:hypothetical protein
MKYKFYAEDANFCLKTIDSNIFDFFAKATQKHLKIVLKSANIFDIINCQNIHPSNLKNLVYIINDILSSNKIDKKMLFHFLQQYDKCVDKVHLCYEIMINECIWKNVNDNCALLNIIRSILTDNNNNSFDGRKIENYGLSTICLVIKKLDVEDEKNSCFENLCDLFTNHIDVFSDKSIMQFYNNVIKCDDLFLKNKKCELVEYYENIILFFRNFVHKKYTFLKENNERLKSGYKFKEMLIFKNNKGLWKNGYQKELELLQE